MDDFQETYKLLDIAIHPSLFGQEKSKKLSAFLNRRADRKRSHQCLV